MSTKATFKWHNAGENNLEYDFVVAPGADPAKVAVAFDGADGLRLDGGQLVVETKGGELRQHAPKLYQDHGGHRVSVPGHFVLHGDSAGLGRTC